MKQEKTLTKQIGKVQVKGTAWAKALWLEEEWQVRETKRWPVKLGVR